MTSISDPTWLGMTPPQLLLHRRRFKGIALDPPSFEPGSWNGAGKVLFDEETRLFWLTTRPRKVGVRGYAVEIYSSRDGEQFRLEHTIPKDKVSSLSGVDVKSIEGQQILKNPSTGRYHLYLAVDVASGWETFLFTSEKPKGPWNYNSVAIARGEGYDAREARDCSMGIVDGLYFALYKANSGGSVKTALATSGDGIEWRKRGVLTIDGDKCICVHQQPVGNRELINLIRCVKDIY